VVVMAVFVCLLVWFACIFVVVLKRRGAGWWVQWTVDGRGEAIAKQQNLWSAICPMPLARLLVHLQALQRPNCETS